MTVAKSEVTIGSSVRDTEQGYISRMKVYMLDSCTPLVVSATDLIGDTCVKLGLDSVIDIDYVYFDIGGTPIAVPILAPSSLMGSEIVSTKTWANENLEALKVLIGEKVVLAQDRGHDIVKGVLSTYEGSISIETGIDNIKESCRNALDVAKIYAAGLKENSGENIEWIRELLRNLLVSQYENCENISQEAMTKVQDFYSRIKDKVYGDINAPSVEEINTFLHNKGNVVFERIKQEYQSRIVPAVSYLETAVHNAVGEDNYLTIQNANEYFDEYRTLLKERACSMCEMQVFEYAIVYVQECIAATVNLSPSIRMDMINNVMFQASVVIKVIKNKVEQFIDYSEELSGFKMDKFRNAWQTSKSHTEGDVIYPEDCSVESSPTFETVVSKVEGTCYKRLDKDIQCTNQTNDVQL